jgi:hypothetical protein
MFLKNVYFMKNDLLCESHNHATFSDMTSHNRLCIIPYLEIRYERENYIRRCVQHKKSLFCQCLIFSIIMACRKIAPKFQVDLDAEPLKLKIKRVKKNKRKLFSV